MTGPTLYVLTSVVDVPPRRVKRAKHTDILAHPVVAALAAAEAKGAREAFVRGFNAGFDHCDNRHAFPPIDELLEAGAHLQQDGGSDAPTPSTTCALCAVRAGLYDPEDVDQEPHGGADG